MIYLETIAVQIAEYMGETYSSERDLVSEEDQRLWLAYALLCVAKGSATTGRDVHDAWASVVATTRPVHPSLVPYDQLELVVQIKDEAFCDAIRYVALKNQREQRQRMLRKLYGPIP